MRQILILALAASLALGACARVAESRFNPLNWFGAGRPVVAAAEPAGPATLVPEGGGVTVVDARPPLQQIVALRVDPTPDGAIVRATGLAAGPGYFNAELVRVGLEGGTLVYDFRAEPPPGAVPGGSAAQREVTAADVIAASELGGVRAVRVRTAGGSLEAAR